MGITDNLSIGLKAPEQNYHLNYLLVALPSTGNPTFYEAIGYLYSFADRDSLRTPFISGDLVLQRGLEQSSSDKSNLEYFLTVLESDANSAIILADIKDSTLLKNELPNFLERYNAKALICQVSQGGTKAHYHFK